MQINSGIKPQPIIWVDMMRSVAAFIVVLAHVPFDWAGEPAWAYTLYYSFSRIGVPIFFLISGYLLLSKQEPILDFSIKRVTRIALPFLVWSIVYDVINSQTFVDAGVTFEGILKMFIRIIRGPRAAHLWFFYSLIGLYLFTPILRVFVAHAKKSEVNYYIALWFLAMPILYLVEGLTPIKNGFEIYYIGGYVGYFLLGYYIGKLDNSTQNLKIGLILFIVGFLFTFLVHYYDISPQDNKLVFRSYLSLNIIIMSLGAFLLMKNIAGKAPPLVIKIAHQVSATSFGIFLIHVIIFEWVSILAKLYGLHIQTYNAVISIPIAAVITFLISWLSVYIIQRVPILRSIV
ncbi:MAG: Inner membrane protein YiaH [Chloroflexi bacterium OLB14]|nr:MAG: Inner membrane protein YiaH [Chloroflexi bacterium OLB14]